MKRDEFPEEKMKDAVHDVIENQRSTRSVAKDFGVNRFTLGRYVKDATRSVDTEDRCYKKSFVTKQVGLGINYVFRVNTFLGGYLYKPTYVGPTWVRTCVHTYVRMSLGLSVDLMFCMSTASRCLPVLRRKPCRHTWAHHRRCFMV